MLVYQTLLFHGINISSLPIYFLQVHPLLELLLLDYTTALALL